LVYVIAMGIMLSSPIVHHRVSKVIEGLQQHLNSEGDVVTGKRYSKYIDRIYMWRWAIALFIKHPLIGVGTGGYKKAILLEGGDQGISHPHNNILHMGVSFGIFGLFVFGWLFWILLKAGWQHRHSLPGFFILASSLVILIGGLTDTHILDAGGLFLLALTTGLLSLLPKREFVEDIQGSYL
ncbi:MAG: O-antigen ligase family protein, partial [Deltaproteobacteria bacterium]|nr:O-antigen ligase family protein [Deltaproteobacteria bacterium]